MNGKNENGGTTTRAEKIIPLPLVLSGFAVFISICTGLWVLSHEPLGKGLSQYNLTTPRDALLSSLKIQEKHDLKAMVELANFLNRERLAERQDSLQVWKEAEWRGRKILFCSWVANGITDYSCQAFEKDAETGYWLPSSVPYVFDLEKTGSAEDRRLSKMVSEWRNKGHSSTATFAEVARELMGD